MGFHIKNYVREHESFASVSMFLDMFFLTSYEPEERTRWYAATGTAFAVALVAYWVFPVRLWALVRARGGRKQAAAALASTSGQDVWENDSMNVLPEEMGFVERNLRTRSLSRVVRRAVSHVLFLVALAAAVAVQAAVVFRKVASVDLAEYIPDASLGVASFTSISVWDFLVVLANNVLDFLGRYVAGWLTHLEAHKRRITHSRHKTVKLFVFKFVVVNTMYITQKLVYVARGYYTSECPMRPVASKFLVFMVMNLTVGNLSNWLVPLVLHRRVRRAQRRSRPYKPVQFDIAFEYMELFYRQYVMYLGMTVFPAIVPIAIIINLIEYASDKYRLLLLSRETKKVVLSAFNQWAYFVPCTMSVLAVLAFVFWPDGAMWSLNLFDFTTFVPAHNFFLSNASSSSSTFGDNSLADVQTNYYARCSVFNYTSTPVFNGTF